MSATKVSAFEPCESALSMVDMGVYGVGYASPNGFVVVRAGTATVFTEPMITPEQWRECLPKTMRCAWHRERLHVVSDVGHWVFAMREGDDLLTMESALPVAMWQDIEQDFLWFVDGDRLNQHGMGADARLRWRSGETQYQRPVSFVRAKVEADAHPVTLTLHADGAEVLRHNTNDNEPFYLPVLPRSKHWVFGIESTAAIHRVVVSLSLIHI